ncbi:MAG: peptide MFS transporter [Ignavibacteriaceae bacterium]
MFKNHPKGLYVLFFTEMWERFSYYGNRAIISLFMIKALLYDNSTTSSIYGYYTGFVYLTALFGGYIADKYWGNRKSIFVGGFLMAIGQFSLAFCGQVYANRGLAEVFFIGGLLLLIIGNGFFKPNISTMVGSLYPESEIHRRDSAFTIFYMGINVGAFLGPLICGGLGDTGSPADFKWGFFAAGVGMLLGLVHFYIQKDKYLVTPDGKSVGLVPVRINKKSVDYVKDAPLTKIEKQRIAVIFIISFFVIFFWAAYEQAGVSLTFFAESQTNRVISWLGNYSVPASFFQSVNPVVLFIFAPAFAWLWTKLGNKGKEPSSPLKMSIGLMLLGLGYVVMAIGGNIVQTGIKVSPMWLVLAYSFHTFGELCLSPIGLSVVTKLSPAKFMSLLMGVWFLANAAANWLAGQLSTLYPINIDGTTSVHYLLGFAIKDLSSFFLIFVIMAAASSLILFFIYKQLLKMMHGIE